MRRTFPHCNAASIGRDRFRALHSIRLDCDENLEQDLLHLIVDILSTSPPFDEQGDAAGQEVAQLRCGCIIVVTN
jgi:hypothetical protein